MWPGWCASTILVVATLATSMARAQTKRADPSFDGRSPGDEAHELALWAARSAAMPAYVATEHLVRQPFRDFVLFGEEHGIFGVPSNAVVGAPKLRPIARFELGRRFEAGLRLTAPELAAADDQTTVIVSSGGRDLLAGTIAYEAATRDTAFRFTLSDERRPDAIFAGIGPRADRVARYSFHAAEARVDVAFELASWVSLGVLASARRASFGDGSFDEDPTVRERAAAGDFSLPEGFDRGVAPLANGVVLDLRARGSVASASLVVVGEHGVDTLTTGHWTRLGATGDLSFRLATRHAIRFLAAASSVDPIGTDRPVPFSELATLGGDDAMPGFLPGRLRDRTAVAVNAEYRWPVWVWLDAFAGAGAGNVFGAGFDDLAPDLLRGSLDVGIRSADVGDYGFRALVGVGTRPFAEGASIDAVRVLVALSTW